MIIQAAWLNLNFREIMNQIFSIGMSQTLPSVRRMELGSSDDFGKARHFSLQGWEQHGFVACFRDECVRLSVMQGSVT